MPAISVVIPSYQRAHVVGRALLALRRQTFADFEVIVVDDGSTDGTGDVVRAFDDCRVRYLRQTNLGVSAARNAGAAAAAAPLLTFLDTDDLPFAGWLDELVRAFASPGTRVSRVGHIDLTREGTVHEVLLPRPFADIGHTLGTFLPGTFAIDRAFFDQIGGYVDTLRFGENTELAMRVIDAWHRARFGVALSPTLMLRREWSDRSVKYHAMKETTTRYVLDHHRDLLARHPESLQVQLTSLGVSAARRGDIAEARRNLLDAWHAQPLRPRVAARAATAYASPLARRVWPAVRRDLPSDGAPRPPVAALGAPPPRSVVIEPRPPDCHSSYVEASTNSPGDAAVKARLLDALAGADIVSARPEPDPGAPHLPAGDDAAGAIDPGRFAAWSDVLDAIGGVDERLPAHRGRELAWRAQLAGYRVAILPDLPGATMSSDAVALGRADVQLAARYGAAGVLSAGARVSPRRIAGRVAERIRRGVRSW
ncbi:MAG: hypothetical protein JWL83_3184 [Actinomycetia bacterium]|nr:hypothetical protein [Actinomycetes bacterium]